MSGLKFLLFVVLTIVAWGAYGPVLHRGQVDLGDGVQLSRWKPLVCVGMAYFLIAVLYPAVMIPREGKGNWSPAGIFWSFVAGAVGAFGAFGIILAFMFGGKPLFVMPLVFGFAPVINTIVTALMARTMRQASVMFYLGVLVVAVGGAGVMFFNPKPAVRHAQATELVVPELQQNETVDTPGAGSGKDSGADQGVSAGPVQSSAEFWLMIGSVALTALCWGSYGPVLHKGQARMGGSRLRPFLLVGLAYLVFAVIVPLAFWQWLPEDPGQLNPSGIAWSLFAGAVGALGALGIIYAFNFGGKPVTIMPLVFGGAPVINTMITTISNNTLHLLSTPFFVSLFLVIAGAVTVLVFAPRGDKPPLARA